MPLVLFNPSIGHISNATTPGRSGPRSDSNKGVPRIPQSSSIAGTLQSHCLVSYQDTRWGGSYPSAEVPSVYSTAPADWTRFNRGDRYNNYVILNLPSGIGPLLLVLKISIQILNFLPEFECQPLSLETNVPLFQPTRPIMIKCYFFKKKAFFKRIQINWVWAKGDNIEN